MSELTRQREDIIEDIKDGDINRSEINEWNRKAKPFKDDLAQINKPSISSAKKAARETR